MRAFVSGNSSFTLDWSAHLSATIGHGGAWERDGSRGPLRLAGLNATPAVLHLPGMGKTRLCKTPVLAELLRESREHVPPASTVEFYDLAFRRLQVPSPAWELVRLPPHLCTTQCPVGCGRKAPG